MRRVGLRLVVAIVAVLVGAWVVGCARQTSLTHWPARDALYTRYCAIEVRQGRIPFTAFEDCVHRLAAHRGEVCTHPGGRPRTDQGVTPPVSVEHDAERNERPRVAPHELDREIRGERRR